MTHEIRYYWEDLVPGSTRELGSVTVDADEIREFATRYDPQPFHLDEEAARKSVFGALCASGWHTCAMAMRLTVDNFLRYSSSMGSPGLENLRWLKPVLAGDTLRLEHSIVEARPMNSRPAIGLVRSAWRLINQHGEPVMQMEGWGMFRRRHPAPGDPGAPDPGGDTAPGAGCNGGPA